MGCPVPARSPSPHHPAGAAIAKSSWHEDATGTVEELLAPGLFKRLGFNPSDVHAQPVVEPAVVERLVQALVRIFVAHMLSRRRG